jgi:hypothetical protein
MVCVSSVNDKVVFEVLGLHKVWALKSRLEIPRAHIRNVYIDPFVARGRWRGLRMPGTHIKGLITAGTFYKSRQKVFWDVSDTSNAIVVELQEESYDKLIIEVSNPARVIHELTGKPAA